LYIVLGTQGYYGIFPLTINLIEPGEVEYLNNIFNHAEVPLFPLATLPLYNLLKVSSEKFVTFDMDLEVFEKHSLTITYQGNQFEGTPDKPMFRFNEVFPDPASLSRETWYLNKDAIKNISKLTKESVYFYTDGKQRMAYCPIGDESFVAFSFRKHTAEKWISKPNTILSKLSSFSDGEYEDAPSKKSWEELEIERLREKNRDIWTDYEISMEENELNKLIFGLQLDRFDGIAEAMPDIIAKAKEMRDMPSEAEAEASVIQEAVAMDELDEALQRGILITPEEREAVVADAERLGIDLNAHGPTFQAIDEEEVLPTPLPELDDDDRYEHIIYDEDEDEE
jgi:hypothetical protein